MEAAFSVGRPGPPSAIDAELVERLRWVLNESPQAGPSVTETVLKTLPTEPNLEHVRHWKQDWHAAQPAELAAVTKKNGFPRRPPPEPAELSH